MLIRMLVRHPCRQPERKLWPEDHESEHEEHDDVEWDRAEHDLAQLAVPDRLDHEQVDADRRRDLAELDEDHEDDAEQDRIDAVARQHGEEERHGDDDHTEALDQAAEDGEQDQQRDVELELREMQPDDERGDLLADAAERQRDREDVGGENQEQDVAAEIDGVVQRADEAAEGELAERDAEHDRQDAADHRRLGGGDDAEVESAERHRDQRKERRDVG